MPKPYFTLEYQFQLGETALREARNLLKAKYYTSCISHCYQVAHRYAAGLLFAIEASVFTERDVGAGFESAFVSTGKSPKGFADDYKRLFAMRQKADFDHDYLGTEAEAREALMIAERFHEEAKRLGVEAQASGASGPAPRRPS